MEEPPASHDLTWRVSVSNANRELGQCLAMPCMADEKAQPKARASEQSSLAHKAARILRLGPEAQLGCLVSPSPSDCSLGDAVGVVLGELSGISPCRDSVTASMRLAKS